MQQMTLEEIQAKSLFVLKEFHEFCTNNGIRYSLAYGTLLGAVRHKGFIPWDDDIDVMMPRPDYNKFVTLYKDNDNFACFADERKNCFLAYARLADVKTTYVKPASVWANRDTGIWIDIFPIDGVESDKNAYLDSANKATKIWKKVYFGRDAISSHILKEGFWAKIKWIVYKLVFGKSVYRHLYRHLEFCHRYDYDSCDFVSNMSILIYSNKSFFPKEMFEHFELLKFDGTDFFVISGYRDFLEMIYGDYMKLPPESERRYHNMHRYYWK